MFRKLFSTSLVLLTLLVGERVSAQEASPPKIPAQTITSDLEMGIYIDAIDSSDGIFSTPGTVKLPQCTRRRFSLYGLNEKNVEAYKKELIRLGVRSVSLPLNTTSAELKTYVDAGLLTNVTSLRCYWCNDLTDITSLAKLPNLTSLDLNRCFNLSDITPLAKLQKLTYLNFSNCAWLTDLTPLAKLKNLTYS